METHWARHRVQTAVVQPYEAPYLKRVGPHEEKNAARSVGGCWEQVRASSSRAGRSLEVSSPPPRVTAAAITPLGPGTGGTS